MKPCPFCGSEALENLDSAAAGGAVHCIDCGARGPSEHHVLALRMGTPGGIADGLEAWDVRAEASS